MSKPFVIVQTLFLVLLIGCKKADYKETSLLNYLGKLKPEMTKSQVEKIIPDKYKADESQDEAKHSAKYIQYRVIDRVPVFNIYWSKTTSLCIQEIEGNRIYNVCLDIDDNGGKG